MEKIKIGDIIRYASLMTLEITNIDDKYYYLTDKSGYEKPIYKDLVEKYGIIL